jgi:hypothetical protein
MSDQNGLAVPNLSGVEGDGSSHIDFGRMADFAKKVNDVDDGITNLMLSLMSLSQVSTQVGSGQYADEISRCYGQVIGHETAPAIQKAIEQLRGIQGKVGKNSQIKQNADQAGADTLNNNQL